MDKIERIKELVGLLNHYRDEYYNNQNSEVSDFEYDQLYDELSALEQETEFIMTVSPTQTVGYEVKSELTKVKHNHPMLSLDKTKDINDVVKFLGNKDGLVMPKMDGLTCSLRYLDGKLVSAETRGNGEIGEDILHCAKTIKNIPLHIDYKDELIIDGEVIISYDDFEKINSTLPEDQKYKHPRNLASGSIRQLDSKIAAERNLKFIAWKVIKGWDKALGLDSNSFCYRLGFAEFLGFDVVDWYGLPDFCRDERIISYAIDVMKKWAKDNSYPIDGCVFSYDDVAYGDSLGATGHHLRSQYAYKFYDELYETKLINVEWTLGKTNTLTPTAVFETVQIDGTDISKASLHNISIIKKLGLTNHCTCFVYKANQVIPQIDSCLKDGDSEIVLPQYCPVCGGKTAVIKENESEVLVCTNPNCSGKLLGRLKFFVSKPAMNIEGLSEQTLAWLIDKGWINSFKDIYHLSDHKDEWQRCDGFGKKSVEKMLDAIEKSRNVKLSNFICALSIDGIGIAASKTIAEHFNNDFDAFFRALTANYDWSRLSDFGEITARNIANFGVQNGDMVRELAKEMRFVQEEKKEVKENPMNGKKFCITGSFSQSRDILKQKLEALGAIFVSGVSKNLDVLFVGEKAGSKLTKAQSLGVRIAYEDELMNLLGE